MFESVTSSSSFKFLELNSLQAVSPSKSDIILETISRSAIMLRK